MPEQAQYETSGGAETLSQTPSLPLVSHIMDIASPTAESGVSFIHKITSNIMTTGIWCVLVDDLKKDEPIGFCQSPRSFKQDSSPFSLSNIN